MDRKNVLCAIIEELCRRKHLTLRDVTSRTTAQRIMQRDRQLTYTTLLKVLIQLGYTTGDYYILLHMDHPNYPNTPRRNVHEEIVQKLKNKIITIYNEKPQIKTTRTTQRILVGVFGLLTFIFFCLAFYGIISFHA
ncbi:hypothetical protein COW46_00770 [Candidatus Gracilibacteria bacterium CG17_big_fil_post_rev_8_21_14_2_50_48_13]|nr:MAG: hypothetical protein COW46_00770 [Candidatus Gracilibacteria bacterium CG17_big_fil_post_rev_8_21_14_2_50_48_13]